MLKRLIALVVLLTAGAAAVFVVGMRTKSPLVLDAVRRSNRAYANPRQLESAGQTGSKYSVVEHTGRRSGATYRTPVGVIEGDGAFVISLPYGAGADWVQNVLSAGSATVVHQGETWDVDRPKIVAIDDAPVTFSPAEALTHRLFGVDQAILLRRAGSTTT